MQKFSPYRLKDSVRQCKYCGCAFTPHHNIQMYHNKSCRQKAILARNREQKQQLAEQIVASHPRVTAQLVTKKYGCAVRVFYMGRTIEVLDSQEWESVCWAWGLKEDAQKWNTG